jgi:hypothetical protein
VQKKDTFSVQFIEAVSAVSDQKKAVDGKEQTVCTTFWNLLLVAVSFI